MYLSLLSSPVFRVGIVSYFPFPFLFFKVHNLSFVSYEFEIRKIKEVEILPFYDRNVSITFLLYYISHISYDSKPRRGFFGNYLKSREKIIGI